MSCEVLLTQRAESFLLENVTLERVMRRIEETVELLGAYPLIGKAYDPSYHALPFRAGFFKFPTHRSRSIISLTRRPAS